MSIRAKYFISGALFGMCFPVGALVFELQRLALSLDWENIVFIHQQNRILYMIDSAPVFLGLFALIGGISKEKSVFLIHELKRTADFLAKNTDVLRQQTESTLTQFLSSINGLSTDYQTIDELNRSTYNEVSSAIEGSGKVGAELDIMKTSLEKLSIQNSNIGNSHNKIYHYLETYITQVGSLEKYFNYLSEFSKKIEMLAINSSIEANKFGVQGKAFMVFAQDVHNLANETKARNKTVLEVVREISRETSKLSEILEAEQGSVNRIKDLGRNVDTSIKQFSEVIQCFIENLHEAITHLDRQNQLTLIFGDSIQNIGNTNMEVIHKLSDVVQKQINLIDKMEQVSHNNS